MPATAPALSMKVSPSGDIALSLGAKSVASGRWYLTSIDWHGGADKVAVGGLVSSTAVQDTPGHAVVTDTFTSAKSVCDIQLDGEDLHLAMHVTNLNATQSLQRLVCRGLTFQFDRNPDASIPSFHWTYLQAQGDAIFHPSLAAPLGAVYARDDQFGFAAFSNSEFDRPTLFNASWQQAGIIPAQCQVEMYTQREVPGGGAADVDAWFRVSTDISLPNLMGGYKKVYSQHFSKPLYRADHRAVAQFAAEGPTFISRFNPCGFNGGFRRLDLPIGVGAYVHMIAPPLHEADALGIIFWGLGGWNPPMYPPDFDQFPASVQANIPKLVNGFKSYGLRVGLCTRPGDGITRDPGKAPLIYRLDASKPADMQMLLDRFSNAMAMGFDIFYLDSFGADGVNDLEILKKVRERVGPDVLLYTEYCTDMSLPYADHYCEWVKGSILWTSPGEYAALRYLCPDATWLCMSRESRPIPLEFPKLGLTPLVQDQLSNRLPASQPTR